MLHANYVENKNIRYVDNQVKTTLDCREGVVADSYLAIAKSGVMFIVLDTYETAWTSGYTVITADTEKELMDRWNAFTAEYDKGVAE